MHPLLALADDEIGPFYEARVLDGIEVDIQRYGHAYRQLSERLNLDLREPTGGWRETAEARVIWQLIYGFRTVVVTRKLLRRWPFPDAPFVELGAGCGPMGLVAAAHGLEVTLVDVDQTALEDAGPFYDRFGLDAPKVRRADARKTRIEGSTHGLPYVVGEWDDLKSLRRLLASEPCYVLEHGTKRSGHAVQSLRDQVHEVVSGPCPPMPACSLQGRTNDWCHFTWNIEPGPQTRRIAASAGRNWNVLHSSFLTTNLGPPDRCGRVMGQRRIDRYKAMVDICTAEGAERLIALKRNHAIAAALESLEAGDAVSLGRAEMTKKGDGLRLESPKSVERVSSLRST